MVSLISRQAPRGVWTATVAGIVYLVAMLAGWLVFGVGASVAALPADLALHLTLAFLLAALFPRRWCFVLVLGVFTVLLHLAHAGKMATLGGPLSPDDFFAVRSFLLIAAPWQRHLVLGGGLLLALAALRGFGWKRPRCMAAALAVVGLGLTLSAAPGAVCAWMDHQFGHVEWDPAGNYRRRGPTVHSLQETVRFLAARRPHPAAAEVAAVLPPPRAVAGKPPRSAAARNLHVIVLESFWDAGLLKAALSDDPLPPDFRALWAQTGESRAISPVFGGYTANAEFEALCGFPVTEPGVAFERHLTREVDCLPKVLGDGGYSSVASHPNIPVFWNRHNVYQRIGFEHFWAGSDFVGDDLNGEFLSDRSLYRQVLEKIEPLLGGDKPLFNYVLTFFGHQPYPLAEDRPLLFPSRSAYPDVAAYATTLYWKARDLMDFLAQLRQRDPEGLIVVFGDHLPVLGGLEAYVESALIAPDRADYTPEMYLTLSATPLVIIDGKNGPVPVGDLPMYRLPALILSLLGDDRPTLFDYTAMPAGTQVRPLPGVTLNLSAGGVEICARDSAPSASCAESDAWLERIRVLAADLFVGEQFALPVARPERTEEASTAGVDQLRPALPRDDRRG